MGNVSRVGIGGHIVLAVGKDTVCEMCGAKRLCEVGPSRSVYHLQVGQIFTIDDGQKEGSMGVRTLSLTLAVSGT